MSVYVIAEAGVNHNGDVGLARELVDVAAKAGADAVKFQTFAAERLVTATAPKAAYQRATTGAAESQFAMLRRLELAPGDHHEIKARCRERGIDFLSTPFDEQSLDFLVRNLGLGTLKIASGEVTNGPLLLHAAQSGCNIILSTGMSTLAEVREALGVLAFGLVGRGEASARAAFAAAYESEVGRRALGDKVTLLHCTSAYPAPDDEANLKAMDTLRRAFGLRVGLSDHTADTLIAVAAAAREAAVVEKHFTLDRSLPGPDHRASLEPGDLGQMIRAIRTVARALGDGVKAPVPSERETMAVARRSLVALAPIRAGEPFTAANIGARRPGTGRSPMEYWDLLGRTSERDLAEGEPLP